MERSGLSDIRALLNYAGLTKDEFALVRSQIIERNDRTLKITSIFVTIFGVVFFLINCFIKHSFLLPYIFLASGGLLIILLRLIPRRSDNLKLFLCYAMMVLVFAYAVMLSTTEVNKAIPATSIIVFFVLLPVSVDDRPIRMILFVVASNIVYLVFSYLKKSPSAFSLDMLNAVTFMVVGCVFYVVICQRNIMEIYQSLKNERLQKDTISSLATIIEERDECTGHHIANTERYVEGLIGKMKEKERYRDIPEEYYDNVHRAAPMHDIGKIKIPDMILNKPGKLTEEEYELMKQHTVFGARIIDETMSNVDDKAYLAITRNIVLHHHERYDGKGYPAGLKGEEIPLESRIMALADVYDALVSERPYKKAFSQEKAKEIILEGRGTQFDPVLTDLFLDYIA